MILQMLNETTVYNKSDIRAHVCLQNQSYYYIILILKTFFL